jgi:enoyl-CoA hydratase/carnithine racemase
VWDGIIHRGRVTMQRLVDVEMPLIAAANGPASVHSEGMLLADIAIAEHSTVFSDYSHPAFGTVPGDGVALIWQEVLGINRARVLSLTGGSFTAQQACEWGAVAEVVPDGGALTRALELAETQAAKAATLTRAMSITLRQRLSRRVAEGIQLGMALEGLPASDKAYQQPH